MLLCCPANTAHCVAYVLFLPVAYLLATTMMMTMMSDDSHGYVQVHGRLRVHTLSNETLA